MRINKALKKIFTEPKELEDILAEQVKNALKEHNRSTLGLFLSAFNAGLEVGFSFFLMCIMYTLFFGEVSESTLRMILAFSYPVGFIFVVIGHSELFTEHTALAVLPVFTRAATVRSLLILWLTIFTGNLFGGYVFSHILLGIGPAMGIADKDAFFYIASHVLDYPPSVIFMSAVVAGWLMGLLAWLVTASKETGSSIFIIILITSLIGLGGLHHSIVGSIEVFTGMMSSPEISLKDYINFQLWATLGNLVGGVFFVAIIKYSHTPLRNRR